MWTYYLWGFDSPMIDHGKVNPHATIACGVFPLKCHVRSYYSKFPRRFHNYYPICGREKRLGVYFVRHVEHDWGEKSAYLNLIYQAYFLIQYICLFFNPSCTQDRDHDREKKNHVQQHNDENPRGVEWWQLPGCRGGDIVLIGQAGRGHLKTDRRLLAPSRHPKMAMSSLPCSVIIFIYS